MALSDSTPSISAFPRRGDLLSFVSKAIPGFTPTGELQELSGGILNYVWRVFGEGQSVIVKHAPPYIAKAPDIPIDPQRVVMEARVLSLFNRPPWSALISSSIRPAQLLYSDEQKYAILLEDVGDLQSLDGLDVINPHVGTELGAFFNQLHIATFQNKDIAAAIDNKAIQQTRLEVLYTSIHHLLENFGIADAAGLGRKAKALGEKYLTKGKCLTMGDFWPRAILVDTIKDQIRIIDWEFAHFGRPAQDVAHFLAHLWMLQHQASSLEKKKALEQLQAAFVKSYWANPEISRLFDEEEIEGAGIHFGAEILARTIGDFQNDYLYEELDHGHVKIREAVAEAVGFMRKPTKFAQTLKQTK